MAAQVAAPSGLAWRGSGVDLTTHRLLSAALGLAQRVDVAEAIVDVALPVFNPLNVKAAIGALCNLESACASAAALRACSRRPSLIYIAYIAYIYAIYICLYICYIIIYYYIYAIYI